MEVCSKRHITGFLSFSVTFNESDNDKNRFLEAGES